jgi:hypothetical protein
MTPKSFEESPIGHAEQLRSLAGGNVPSGLKGGRIERKINRKVEKEIAKYPDNDKDEIVLLRTKLEWRSLAVRLLVAYAISVTTAWGTTTVTLLVALLKK